MLGLWTANQTKKNMVGGSQFTEWLLPNCQWIDDTLQMDRTEISNSHWLEYLAWKKRIFGKRSKAYELALPDTNVWSRFDPELSVLDTFYLRHPAYQDYPVVGITREQAMDFANWRGDRVFEYMLIRDELIEEEVDQDSNSYFTIERYFEGNYFDYEPIDYDTVPHFRLPSNKEWTAQLKPCSNITKKKTLRQMKKPKYEGSLRFEKIRSFDKACVDGRTTHPTKHIFSEYKEDDSRLYNLRGNVSEWLLDEPDSTAGGGWIHSEAEICSNHLFHTMAADAATGFRCIGEYRALSQLSN